MAAFPLVPGDGKRSSAHGFQRQHQAKAKHMKKYKVIRIIGVILLVLGAAMIILALMEGEKSVIQSIAAGGGAIALGAALFGISLRLGDKEKSSGGPSDIPK
jgi:drug/metabolite transporter (DMT)-like permease